MNIISSHQITEQFEDIIHEDTQLHEHSIDLTVNEIHKFKKSGSLDFGGSEFEQAPAIKIEPEKQNEDDDYGWWNLAKGRYKAIFNEEITADDKLAVISPHEHARKSGILANTICLSGRQKPLTLIFDVPQVGCNIKENARFAAAVLFSME